MIAQRANEREQKKRKKIEESWNEIGGGRVWPNISRKVCCGTNFDFNNRGIQNLTVEYESDS